ncbi:hypothetical protein CRM22_006172 [Opisthorchis felineus]|uniref:RH1 domain-containing protein n=1 Tax=Opisthorchis felineus TaxID=147828 RepID=A0A4S2LMK2_OPIFE|nr:hypothetical protein CRM22_006172 [Opisthorchis felineus]
MEPISGESRADDTATLSPRVYQLAQHVYKELESLRRLHGESSLGGLLPLTLKMLEEMDGLYNERRQLKIDLKLQVAEKNDVVFQLERAKTLHDTAVKRVNYLEDELLATKKEADEKVDKLEARIRHHEMLSRNAAEHAFRLEERAAQLQSELSTAQDRYTELLRAYVDQTERIRLTDADSVSQLTIRSSKAPMQAPQSDWDWKICGETAKTISGVPKTPVHQRSDSPDQLDEDGFLKLNSLPTVSVMEEMKPADRVASFMDRMDETMEYESTIAPNSVAGQDTEDEEEAVRNAEPTECVETYGIMREVEKLIAENSELSATKNALNVVKNDLICKLDTVSGEKMMLAKEVEYLRLSRDQTKAEANRLARQINTYQKQLSHLHTRLKQYEDVEDLLPLEVVSDLMTSQSNLQHAASCLTLTTPKSENQSLISPLARQAAALPGSLDCVVFNRVSVGVRPDDVKGNQKPEGFRMDYTGGSLASIQECMQNAKLGEACFTKREMARVIAERNQYKESLLELQDAIRCMEQMRADREAGLNAPRASRSSTDYFPGRSTRRVGFARQLISALQSAADEFASGLYGIFSELEPMFSPTLAPEVQDVGFAHPNSWHGDGESATPHPENSDELRRMFGRLIGHAAGQSTEAVFGTGNDFAAAVTSQTISDAIPHLLERRNVGLYSPEPAQRTVESLTSFNPTPSASSPPTDETPKPPVIARSDSV